MSYHEYISAKGLLQLDPPFYALLMAAIQKADTPNTDKFKTMWPELWAETNARYNAPGGILESDRA